MSKTITYVSCPEADTESTVGGTSGIGESTAREFVRADQDVEYLVYRITH